VSSDFNEQNFLFYDTNAGSYELTAKLQPTAVKEYNRSNGPNWETV